MGEPVEAGIIADAIKNVGNLFDKLFDFAEDKNSPYKITDKEEIKDNGEGSYSEIIEVETPKGNKFKSKVIYSRDKNSATRNLYLLSSNGKKATYENIDERNIDKYFNKFAEDAFNEVVSEDAKKDSEELEEFDEGFNSEETDGESEEVEEVEKERNLAASKIIQAKFSKVQGSDEITLDAIYCNYEPVEVYKDLNEVTESDAFEELMEDYSDAYIEVEVTDDGYDIREIEEDDMRKSELNSMLSSIYAAQIIVYVLLQYNELKFSHHNIDYRHDLQDKMWLVKDEMGVVASMLSIGSEAYDYKKGPHDILNETLSNTDWGSTIANGLDVGLALEQYCMVLDLYYPNLPHELQQLVNGWLASLRFEVHRY